MLSRSAEQKRKVENDIITVTNQDKPSKRKSVFSERQGNGIELHPTGGARTMLHGITYQTKMLMLWIFRAFCTEKVYKVSTEDSRVGKFDDFYLEMEVDENTTLQQFIQLKHNSSKNKSALTFSELLPNFGKQSNRRQKGDFDLKIYFESFMEIQKIPSCQAKENNKQMFILYTNKSIKYGDEINGFNFKENIFECIVDETVLNTNLLKFSDNFHGRELLIRHLSDGSAETDFLVDQFLKCFYIAQNQPNESELSDIIKKELECTFPSRKECAYAYNQMFADISEWIKGDGTGDGTMINHFKIKEYFESLKHTVNNSTYFALTDPIANFHGRKSELQRMKENLKSSKFSNKINISISGMSGVGKSELVRFYTKNHRKEYDCILWISANSVETLDNSFINLYTALNIPENKNLKDKSLKEKCQQKIQEIYKFLEDKKCLFVYDDMNIDPLHQQIGHELQNYLPVLKSEKHHMIVTTQIQHVPANYEIKLGNFSEHESLNYLKENVDNRFYDTDSKLNCICETFSNHPLALQIFCAFLKAENRNPQIFLKPFFTVEDFLNLYKKQCIDIPKYKVTFQPIRVAYELCIQRILKSNSKNRILALHILHTISLLQRDHIPIQMFLCTEVNEKELGEAISLLSSLSLVRTERGSLFVNSLTQDMIRARILKKASSSKLRCAVDDNGNIKYYTLKTIIGSSSAKLACSGNFTLRYLLNSSARMFLNCIQNIQSGPDYGVMQNAIYFNLFTFIQYATKFKFFVYRNLQFILDVLDKIARYDLCLMCIAPLKKVDKTLRNSSNSSKRTEFKIKIALLKKYLQILHFDEALNCATECKNLITQCTNSNKLSLCLPLVFYCVTIYERINMMKEKREELLNIYNILYNHVTLKKTKIPKHLLPFAVKLGIELQKDFKLKEAHFLLAYSYRVQLKNCNSLSCTCHLIPLHLAQIYMCAGKYNCAVKILESVFSHNPKLSIDDQLDICIQLSTCYQEEHKFEKATSVLFRYISNCEPLSQNIVIARNELAKILEMQKLYDKASLQLESNLFTLLLLKKQMQNINLEVTVTYNNKFSLKSFIDNPVNSDFKQLLFNAVRIRYSFKGFESAQDLLQKVQSYVGNHLGVENDFHVSILKCYVSLFEGDSRFKDEMQCRIQLLQLVINIEEKYQSLKSFNKLEMVLSDMVANFAQRKNLGHSKIMEDLADSFQGCTILYENYRKRMQENSTVQLYNLFGLMLLKFLYSIGAYEEAKILGLREWKQIKKSMVSALYVHTLFAFLPTIKSMKKLGHYNIALKTINDVLDELSKSRIIPGTFIVPQLVTPSKQTIHVSNEITSKYDICVIKLYYIIEKFDIYFRLGEREKCVEILANIHLELESLDNSFFVIDDKLFYLIKKICILSSKHNKADVVLNILNQKNDIVKHHELYRLITFALECTGNKQQANRGYIEAWKFDIIVSSPLSFNENGALHVNMRDNLHYLRHLEHKYVWRTCNSVVKLHAEDIVDQIQNQFHIAVCLYMLNDVSGCKTELNTIDNLLLKRNYYKNKNLETLIKDISLLKEFCTTNQPI